MYMCIYICVCIYIYIFVYIYIHTNINLQNVLLILFIHVARIKFLQGTHRSQCLKLFSSHLTDTVWARLGFAFGKGPFLN